MNAVVIGGGLAGLVAARELLRQGYRVTLCEASPHLGGMIARSNVGGITVDSGAEAFATRIPAARELCAELGLETAAPAGSPHIWWPEGIVSMAEGVLGIPAGLDDPALKGLTSDELAEARRDLEMDPRVGADAVSVADLVEARMGRAAVDKLVGPVARGVYASDPSSMALAQFAPGLKEAVLSQGSLLGAVARLRRPGTAAVEQPVGGMFRLIDALEADVRARGGHIRTITPISTIRHLGVEFVVTAGDVELRVDRVVIATEAVPAVSLLGQLGVHVNPPSVHLARQTLLAVRHPAVSDGRVGSGLLMGQSSPHIAAKAMTHYSTKWPWATADGVQVLRVSYPTEVIPTRDQALRDVSTFLGQRIPMSSVHGFAAKDWPAMPARIAPTQRARIGEQLAGLSGVHVFGAWLDGNGISPIVAAVRQALA
ncbi:protoporphyrinogen/coproporphyrinogen oxidase [Tessaracoccus caeni]|uniref:protoporphyrinogen/coproporphyrinogen oxidase n=1 Tax=Tessaracoccus caeni TaxID=3031239 RepID=UPI0023DBA7D0|nr:FAD-dependent oxidoreductase [Tessaracoccus caeni]MDF1490033.1 FAD-dependent oxidoreductase [Tessaracoccus caeni]